MAIIAFRRIAVASLDGAVLKRLIVVRHVHFVLTRARDFDLAIIGSCVLKNETCADNT